MLLATSKYKPKQFRNNVVLDQLAINLKINGKKYIERLTISLPLMVVVKCHGPSFSWI